MHLFPFACSMLFFNESDLFISVISEIELFAKSSFQPNEEENLRAFLTDRIDIVDLTNAVLLTSDRDLLDLSRHAFRVQNIF